MLLGMSFFFIRNRFNVSLAAATAMASVLIVAITAMALLAPVWIAGKRDVETLARRLNTAVVADTGQEVNRLFNRIEALQETARAVLASGAVDIHDKAGREALFLGLLRADPSISWVSFGFANGDFYGANRRKAGRYRLVESRWGPEAKKATRKIDYHMDYEGALYFTHSKTVSNDYDASARSWHRAAMAANGPVWTGVYRFSSTGNPGINAAVQVKRDGKTVGVVSFAIELHLIGKALTEHMSADEGAAFILSERGDIIASNLPIQPQDGASVRLLPTPATSGNALLESIAEAVSSHPGAFNETVHASAINGRGFLSLTPLGRQGWRIGTVLSESTFIADVAGDRRNLLLTVLAALGLITLAALYITRRLFVAPLTEATKALERFRRFDLDPGPRSRSRIREIRALAEGLENTRRSLIGFSRYAPADLARSLMLEGRDTASDIERRTITVLFIDLKGFTAATERLGHRMAPQLNAFLAAMSDSIKASGGVVDKFIGDAVMALFGAPARDEDHALKACHAALACVAALERLNTTWERQGKPCFSMRVGVNTGRVLVGNIGAPDRLNYTAIGDPVNLAARLESLNGMYGTTVMIGEATYSLVKYDVVARRVDAVRVKGKQEETPVFELLSLTEGEAPVKPEWVARYEDALAAFTAGDQSKAASGFKAIAGLRGQDDPPSSAMLVKLAINEGVRIQRDPAFDRLEQAAAALSAEATVTQPLPQNAARENTANEDAAKAEQSATQTG